MGKDSSEASKGMKFGSGSKTRTDRQVVNNPKTNQGKQELFKKGGEMKESKGMMKKEISFMKAKGAPKSMVKHEMKEAGMKKMAGGGMPMITKDGQKVPAFAADGKGKMAHGGMTKKMAKGGSASARADGIAVKGKTKGKMLAMGGKAC